MCFDYIHCSYPHLHLLVLFFLPESSLPTWIVDPGFCEWQKLSLVIFPHLLYCVYCNVLQFYPFFAKQQDFGFFFFFLTNKFVIVSDALMKGWKGLHVAFLLFFVYHILRDFKESKVRNCRPPPKTITCDADALPLAFLKWEWFMLNHASGLLAFLCSLANRACMNKLCYQESLTYFWLKNYSVIDWALTAADWDRCVSTSSWSPVRT